MNLGLALLFFVLSLLGNLTYGGGVSEQVRCRERHPKRVQIMFHSLERNYIYTNLPWLVGSLGTFIVCIEYAWQHAYS